MSHILLIALAFIVIIELINTRAIKIYYNKAKTLLWKNNCRLDLVFIITEREVKEKDFEKCLQKCFERKIINKKNLTSHVVTDKQINNKLVRERFKKNGINKVNIYNANLSKKNNIYSKEKQETEAELGLSSGPNLLFFKACEIIKHAKCSHFLLLECDAYPVKDYWYEELQFFCKQNDFLIAGSTYKGKCKTNPEDKHINGVALYKNDNELHNLLGKAEQFLKETVKEKREISKKMGEYHKWMIEKKDPKLIQEWLENQSKIKIRKNIRINYDIAIHKYIKNHDAKLHDKVIDCDLITNACKKRESKITSDEYLLEKYKKTVLIHKK